MKNTFTETWTRSNEKLQKATVIIDMYANTKYEDVNPTSRMEYTGLTAWDVIVGGVEAEEVESELAGCCIDENHEYLVLHFIDGNTATFRNSHVDMRLR